MTLSGNGNCESNPRPAAGSVPSNKCGAAVVNPDMKRWESSVEKQIREAMEAGDFDNLPGKGKPLDLSENPFEDPDVRTAHRLLRNAGFAPAFIEERKQIDSELEEARLKLARAWQVYQRKGRDGESVWQRVLAEFQELATGLNIRIRTLNLKVPSGAFQRRLIDVDQELNRAQSGPEL